MELELKDYLHIVRKRLWLIVAFVSISCLAAGLVSFFFLKPVYEASTKLIVNKSNETIGTQQVDLNTVTLNLRLIDTYKEIIKTPAIMNVVVSEHPEFDLTPQELSDKVRVSSVNNTQVMTIVVQDGSYEKAANMVNSISTVFQREITNIMSVDNVSILYEALPNENPSPVKPNVMLNVAIAFVISLMLILAVVILLDYLDDTVKTEKDIEALLELPTLTVVARTTEDDYLPHGSKTQKKGAPEKRAALDQ